MESSFVSIGFKSLINSNRIIADAKQNNMLIDATYGRKTRSVIIMDSGHVVLSLIGSETIGTRLSTGHEIEE